MAIRILQTRLNGHNNTEFYLGKDIIEDSDLGHELTTACDAVKNEVPRGSIVYLSEEEMEMLKRVANIQEYGDV